MKLVDDDPDFLVGLALALDDHFHCNIFTSPDEVHAWAAENGLSLGQLKTSEKSNEITAIPELLRILEIKGV